MQGIKSIVGAINQRSRREERGSANEDEGVILPNI
jgi:hypothetical protein